MDDSITEPVDSAKGLLESLSGVEWRRLFGGSAYFISGVMFAFIKDGALVLRLSEEDRSKALADGVAKPFLSTISSGLSGWVEVVLGESSVTSIRSAHRAARAVARRQSYEQRNRTASVRRERADKGRSRSKK